jgi:hypothetical protein
VVETGGSEPGKTRFDPPPPRGVLEIQQLCAPAAVRDLDDVRARLLCVEAEVLVPLRRRIIRMLVRGGRLEEEVAAGLLCWPHSGFSVHHAIRVDPWDTEGVERLSALGAAIGDAAHLHTPLRRSGGVIEFPVLQAMRE